MDGADEITAKVVLAVASTIVAALATAIVVLWTSLRNSAKKAEARLMAKLDECETKHETANENHTRSIEKIAVLEGELGHVKGLLEGHNEAREDMRGLSELARRVLSDLSGDRRITMVDG